MDDVKYIEVTTFDGTTINAVITHPDGSYTTMLKSTYDEQQAELA